MPRAAASRSCCPRHLLHDTVVGSANRPVAIGLQGLLAVRYFGNDKVASWFPVASLKNMYRFIDRLHTPSVVL